MKRGLKGAISAPPRMYVFVEESSPMKRGLKGSRDLVLTLYGAELLKSLPR